MMTDKAILFFLITLASFINNFLVPLIIYTRKFGLFKKREENFVGMNIWGLIMDGVLAGFINIIIFNLLLWLNPKMVFKDIRIAFVLGFGSMVLAHVWMSLKEWSVWIMPEPWKWNEAGYWHMVSMTLQMSFCFYPLVLLVKIPKILNEGMVLTSISLAIFLAGLFLLSLKFSQRGLRLGKFFIGAEPW